MKKVICIYWGICANPNKDKQNCSIEKTDAFPLDFSNTVKCK